MYSQAEILSLTRAEKINRLFWFTDHLRTIPLDILKRVESKENIKNMREGLRVKLCIGGCEKYQFCCNRGGRKKK